MDPYAAIAERVFPGATLRSRAPLAGGVSAGVDLLTLRLPDGATREVVLPEDAAVRGTIARATRAPVADARLHGDLWPANVLWRDGSIAGVVDWEDAAIGDPAADVACCRVELHCAWGEEAVAAFTAAYLRAADAAGSAGRAANLPLWDVYVAAAAVASMADWGPPPQVEAHRRIATSSFLARASAELTRRG